MTPEQQTARDILAADWTLLDDPAAFSNAFADAWGSDGIEIGPLFEEARRSVVTDLPLIRDVLVSKLMARASNGKLTLSELKSVMTEMRLSVGYHESDDAALGLVKESLDMEEQEWLDALRNPETLPSNLEAELATLAGATTAPAQKSSPAK